MKKSVFILAIVLLVSMLTWAGNVWAYDSVNCRVVDFFSETRKIFLISLLCWTVICIALILLKKVQKNWIFSPLFWILGVMLVPFFIGYVPVDESEPNCPTNLGELFLFVVWFLPILIAFIQYKQKKIDKKQLLGWLVCPLILGVIILGHILFLNFWR